ncbi:hypothetical protein T492DRAFT_1052589 [Pavlovales sp. CCMP2436]|nr:hypothetical protein T492DRAFT_1052589 [Pavlovales sp. CCMP2436]
MSVLPIDDSLTALAAMTLCSIACAAYCQRCVAGAPQGPLRALAAAPLLALHVAVPLAFDTTTAAVVGALLSATLFAWWGSMKVFALVLSDSGTLAEQSSAPFLTFWAAYFLPVTLAPARGSAKGGRQGDEDTPPGPSLLLARFCAKLPFMIAILALLDPHDDRTPAASWLGPGWLAGDALWSVIVLLAASGLMDFSGGKK